MSRLLKAIQRRLSSKKRATTLSDVRSDTAADAQMDKFDLLLDRIKRGTEIEQKATLRLLHERVKDSENQEDWNHLALGLSAAGQFEAAIHIFEQLVHSFPQIDIYRLSLATTYSQIGQHDLCRYHLRYLVEHGTTEEARTLSGEQLENLERFLQDNPMNRQLQALQIAALRERIEANNATAIDYQRLARILLRLQHITPGPGRLEEATAILEAGHAKYPDALSILELLILCYLRNDPNNQLDTAIKTLEQLDPHSMILNTTLRSEGQDTLQFRNTMLQRAYKLMDQIQSEDPELRKAALQGLYLMITQFPNNVDYRSLYAFALIHEGRLAEAIQHAELIAAGTDESHSRHFNLGQIFWLAGDLARGHQHLALALQYAKSNQEQQDVLNRIAELSRS